jgi:hypothetical protein
VGKSEVHGADTLAAATQAAIYPLTAVP